MALRTTFHLVDPKAAGAAPTRGRSIPTEVKYCRLLRGIATNAATAMPRSAVEGCRPAIWLWLSSCTDPAMWRPASAHESQEPTCKPEDFNAPEQRLRREIVKDLERTPPALFVQTDASACECLEAQRRSAAERLLLAYGKLHPDVGYCQGLNFVAAVLLQVLNEPSALIVLSSLLARLPADMYSRDPDRVMQCRAALHSDVVRVLTVLRPRLARHFDDLEMDMNLFLPRWLSTVFAGVLSVPSTVRLWDYVLGRGGYDAAVGLTIALLARGEAKLLLCEDPGEVVEVLNVLLGEVDVAAIDVMLSCELPRLARVKDAGQSSRPATERNKRWFPLLLLLAGGAVMLAHWGLGGRSKTTKGRSLERRGLRPLAPHPYPQSRLPWPGRNLANPRARRVEPPIRLLPWERYLQPPRLPPDSDDGSSPDGPSSGPPTGNDGDDGSGPGNSPTSGSPRGPKMEESRSHVARPKQAGAPASGPKRKQKQDGLAKQDWVFRLSLAEIKTLVKENHFPVKTNVGGARGRTSLDIARDVRTHMLPKVNPTGSLVPPSGVG